MGFYSEYPLIIGGKPFFAAPAFIPITFEVTVLFGGVAMVIAMFIKSKLKPDIRFVPVDKRITDDRFVILVEAADVKTTLVRVTSVLSGIQTIEIR